MAEPQLYPSVSGNVLANGTEITTDDIALTGQTSGLADDRVIQELLRLAPYDGTEVYKAVIPYDYQFDKIGGTIALPTSTVTPSGDPDGSIAVNPFRAVVGSRVAATTDPLKNWRDIRSGIFTGPGTDDEPPGLAQPFPIVANATGNPRWDLVYATVTVDAQSNPVQRRNKDPSTSAVSAQSVFQYLACTVTVTVLQGTASATPVIPTLPADAAPSYNIALAAVRVINGFNSTTVLVGGDIRALSTGVGYKSLRPGFQMEPATGNNDRAGTYFSAGTHFAWDPATAGSRPSPFIPPDMVGGKCVFALIDNQDPSPANWSHPDQSIVDDSIDWRGRIIFIAAQVYTLSGGSATQTGTSTNVIPSGLTANAAINRSILANSIAQLDSQLIANEATLIYFSHTTDALLPAGCLFGLYVDVASGALKWRSDGTGSSAHPGACAAFMLLASAKMPNH